MTAVTSFDVDIQRIVTLLHLSSPALPIGGFSYSQGLEAAVELGLIHDENSAQHWIEQQLTMVLARSEAPLWCLLFKAWQTQDLNSIEEWNQWFYATRESNELRQETEQMGRSLYKLVHELSWGNEASRTLLTRLTPLTLPCVHAFVCVSKGLSSKEALTAYLFTWLENQVSAAIKSVPLGQLSGQRILMHGMHLIPLVLNEALERSAENPPLLNAFSPQYAIIAARHESQFSRLFRS